MIRGTYKTRTTSFYWTSSSFCCLFSIWLLAVSLPRITERPYSSIGILTFALGGLYLGTKIAGVALRQNGTIELDKDELKIDQRSNKRKIKTKLIKEILMSNKSGMFELIDEEGNTLASIPEGFSHQNEIFEKILEENEAQPGSPYNSGQSLRD